MIMEPPNENLRRHQRHIVENCVMVNNDGVFQLFDVSGGGFSFKCPLHVDVPDIWVSYILTPIGDLKEYTAEKKWAAVYEDDRPHSPPFMKVGAKFGRLAEDQTRHLAELINSISDMSVESSKYYV